VRFPLAARASALRPFPLDFQVAEPQFPTPVVPLVKGGAGPAREVAAGGASVFVFPDENGLISVTVPANDPPYLPPGTQILIINAANGDVGSFTIANDGSLSAQIRGTINDRFLITITSPDGSVTTFERSQFVNPETGETAVGPGGGVVTGPGGVELRIPEGATDKGVSLKIEAFKLEDLPEDKRQTPELGPEAQFGAGLKIESADTPTFKKEVDLAFPLPDGLPETPGDAFFYVYRRIDRGEGKAPLFEVIDHAFIEGEGAARKVVTASYPLPGYMNSDGLFTPGLTMSPVVANYVVLMWSFIPLFPTLPTPGAITGKVLRSRAGAGTVEYDPVQGALVSGVDQGGVPLLGDDTRQATVTRSLADGRFTLWDLAYRGGPVRVAAVLPGTSALQACPDGFDGNATQRCATATEAAPQDWSQTGLRFYRNVATTSIVFPAVAPPPPPPAVRIDLKRIENGQRVMAGEIVVLGTPLLIEMRSQSVTVQTVTLNGIPCTRLQEGPSSWMVDLISDTCRPDRPGTFTVVATGLAATSQAAVSETKSFLVVAAGGNGNNDTVPDAPAVINVLPAADANGVPASGVPVTVYPQVVFSEPVRAGLGTKLLDGGIPVPTRLLGVTPAGAVVDLTADPSVPVTAVTLQPVQALKYGTTYRVSWSADITDLDSPPKALPASGQSFTTLSPSSLQDPNAGETYGSPGIAVVGNRAYLVENFFRNGVLKIYDISDPVTAVKVGGEATVTWRPVDIAAEFDSRMVGGPLVVVATGPTNVSKPSNLYAYDVSGDAPQWIAANSVTNSAMDGFINRITVKDATVYLATFRKGLQVVDLEAARASFAAPGTAQYAAMVQRFNTDGQGHGIENVVTMPVHVTTSTGTRPATLLDLDVGRFTVDGETGQLLVVATGDVPLVIRNPGTLAAVYDGALESPGGRLTSGEGIALGRIANRDVAVVAGAGVAGAAGRVLTVVGLDDARQPSVIGVVRLPITEPITDLVLHGEMALVATQTGVTFVTLTSLAEPLVVGTVSNIGGRLAMGEYDMLFGTARSVFGGTHALGGVRSAALGEAALITKVTPTPIELSEGSEVAQNVRLEYRLVPVDSSVTTAQVEVAVSGGAPVRTLPAAVASDGTGVVTWPSGTLVNPALSYQAKVVAERDGRQMNAFPKKLKFATVPVAIYNRDRMTRIQFALPYQGDAPLGRYNVFVYAAADGQQFPSSPAMSIWADEILGAHENVSVWWNTDRGHEWVTRKIDEMVMPPGTDTTIRRQAFEIGTVFAGYPQLRVDIVGEDGVLRNRREARLTAEGDWSVILERTRNVIRASIGGHVIGVPAVPAPGSFDPGHVFSGLDQFLFRVAHVLDEVYPIYEANLLTGIIDGWQESFLGNVQTYDMLRQAFADPRKAARSFAAFIDEVRKKWPTRQAFLQGVSNFYFEAIGTPMPSADQLYMFSTRGIYGVGFIMGFAAAELVVTVPLSVLTGGFGLVVKEALTAVGVIGWLSRAPARLRTAFRMFMAWFLAVDEAALDLNIAQAATRFLRQNLDKLTELGGRYPGAMQLSREIAAAARVVPEVGARAVYWLTIVDVMSEEAGRRMVLFVANRGVTVADAALGKWTTLVRGRTAVKEAFEAFKEAGEATEGAVHVLVVAADLQSGTPALLMAKQSSPQQRGEVLVILKESMEDARYSDEILARTIRVHGMSPQQALSAPDAVDGTALLLKDASDDLARTESNVAVLLQGEKTKTDELLSSLRGPGSTVDDRIGFHELLEDACKCELTVVTR
jgi:hypothetical protein